MKAEFVNPFIKAALDILKAEIGDDLATGQLRMEESHYTTNDLTIVLGVVGKVSGTVLYGLAERTAVELASTMIGSAMYMLEKLGESAMAELGNMVTGRASMLLEQNGYRCVITPPTLIIGRGAIIATEPFHRLVVPIMTRMGEFNVAVALKETPNIDITGCVPASGGLGLGL